MDVLCWEAWEFSWDRRSVPRAVQTCASQCPQCTHAIFSLFTWLCAWAWVSFVLPFSSICLLVFLQASSFHASVSLSVCFSLSMCIYMCMCVGGVCVCVCSETDMQTFFYCSSSYSLRQGLSVDWRACHFSKWRLYLLLWEFPVSAFPKVDWEFMTGYDLSSVMWCFQELCEMF